MPWPTGNSYVLALQHPHLYFKNAELKAAIPTKDRFGRPRPMTGRFAIVFRMNLSNGRSRAVRCFLSEVADIHDRYQAIGDYLAPYRLSSDWLTGFEYENEGIFIDNRWYPIVVMDWVEGETLGSLIESRHHDQQLMHSLAGKWLTLNTSLEHAGIAHGDLQHENILVHGTDFRLVDYDGMYVPSLRGQRAANEGHPNYQHPHRTSDEFSVEMDRFSALVIYTAIRALAHHPELWRRHNMPDEALLFRKSDFSAPEHSRLFRELLNSSHPSISRPAQMLKAACLNGNKLPALSEIVASRSTHPIQSPTKSGPTTSSAVSNLGKSTNDGAAPWWRSRVPANQKSLDNKTTSNIASGKEQREALLWKTLKERAHHEEQSFAKLQETSERASTRVANHSTHGVKNSSLDSSLKANTILSGPVSVSHDHSSTSPLSSPTRHFDFIGDRYVRQFHRYDCNRVSQISKKALARFNSSNQAQSAGYTPCAICRPLQGRLLIPEPTPPRKSTKKTSRAKSTHVVRIGMTVEVQYSDGMRERLLVVQSRDGHRDQDCVTVTAASPLGRAIIGQPVGSTQRFSANGRVLTVNIISAS